MSVIILKFDIKKASRRAVRLFKAWIWHVFPFLLQSGVRPNFQSLRMTMILYIRTESVGMDGGGEEKVGEDE